MRIFLPLILFLLPVFALPQKINIDSIRNEMKRSPQDTFVVKAYSKAALYYKKKGQTDSALFFLEKSDALAAQLNWHKGRAEANRSLGKLYSEKGDLLKSIRHLTRARDFFRVAGSEQNYIYTTNTMGVTYRYFSAFPEALRCHYEAVELSKKTKNKEGEAAAYNNIGLVFHEQKQYAKAIAYFETAIGLNRETGNKVWEAYNYGNIGTAYQSEKQYVKAIENFRKVASSLYRMGDSLGYAMAENNIGVVYQNMQLYDSSQIYLLRALGIRLSHNDQLGIASSYTNIGINLRYEKKYKEAEEHLKRACDIMKGAGYMLGLQEAAEQLSALYEETSRHKEALIYYKEAEWAEDSLQNEKNTRGVLRSELSYEFGKKEELQKAEREKSEILHREAEQKQWMLLGFTGLALLLITVFSVLLLRRLKLIRHQKKLIEEQKRITEEKQKEVLDSIHYAKRIQQALITSTSYIERNLQRLRKK